jgi:hypothetical protein
MPTEQPALGPGGGKHMSPCTGRAVSIRDSAVLTSAWVVSAIISVADARRCALRISYAADAGGTGNRAQMRVMSCAEMGATGLAPVVATDVWYPPTLIDSTPTAGDLTGTVETGAVLSLVNHGVVVARPGAWTLGDAADAGTQVDRYKLVFDVADDLWLYVAVKELGDTDAGDLGTMAIKANISL